MKHIYQNAPIENFMPHRKPMLLLNSLQYVDESNAKASFTIEKDCIFLNDANELEAVALIEILAQCFAAGNGVTNPQSFGYLASMQAMKIHGQAMLGDTVVAEVTRVASVGDIMVVDGKLSMHSKCIAEGQFKIFAPSSQSQAE